LNDFVHPPAAPSPLLSPKGIPNVDNRLENATTMCEEEAYVPAHTSAILEDAGHLSLLTQREV
jgi:hypothetical protein